MVRRILITGGNGFVGKNLVPRLRDVYWNDNICVPSSQELDLRSREDTYEYFSSFKPHIVIHLAAKVGGIGANAASPGTFIHDNLVMGVNVIEASRLSKVSHFIMTSTVCCYPKFCPVPFREEDIWNGYPEETNAPYGIAKKTLTEMLLAYHREFNFNSTTLIPTNMYGKYDNEDLNTSHVIPALIRKIVEAKKSNTDLTVWGTGEPSREFLYVDDFVDAVLLAIEKGPLNTYMNIGTGKEIKIIDLVEKLANLMDFRGTIFFDKSKPDGQPRRCVSTTRAKELLGFIAKTSLDEGLKTIYEI